MLKQRTSSHALGTLTKQKIVHDGQMSRLIKNALRLLTRCSSFPLLMSEPQAFAVMSQTYLHTQMRLKAEADFDGKISRIYFRQKLPPLEAVCFLDFRIKFIREIKKQLCNSIAFSQ